LYAIALNVHAGINPWKSWANTHVRFSRVDQIPAMIWRTRPVMASSLELTRWLAVVCAIIFFAFFGFADEAKKNYRSVFQTVAKRVGISTGTVTGSSGVLTSIGGVKSKTSGKIRPVPPVHCHRELFRRPDSCGSFSDVSVSIRDVGGFFDEKKANEKTEPFSPTLSYGGITLSDVGGTLTDFNDSPLSPPPSSGSSSADSISVPSPSLTRQSSFAPPPSYPSSPSSPPSTLPDPTTEKSNTSDIV
jgi:pheromone a factor receptor